ncbi:MAG TPA: L,D-transpeptidase [Xanthobacteraceae bacterium]|nr:L,D-transpeptidase [Xanthobacteraceae bacterium]
MQKSQRPNPGLSAYFRNRQSLLVATASVALLAGLESANAFPLNYQGPQDFYSSTRPNGLRVASREKSSVKPKAATDEVAARAKGVLSVIISIDKQQLTLYSDGQPIAHSRVSTGVPSHPTPTGVFSVIQKDRWHRSNLYYNAPMFFMQRVTWSGVAMHQGVVPRGPASHGCIRLPEAFARQMWGITKLGARVIIARSDVTPVPISNERLFTFKREPAEQNAQGQAAASETTGGTSVAMEFAQLRAKPSETASDAMAYAIVPPRDIANTGPELKFAEPRPLKAGPISVFISRREGKLFVRKGFEPVFYVPVTFSEPDRPLGTHVFTALGVNDDNTTLRWNVVSMPGAGTTPAKKPAKGKRVEPPPAPARPASNATDALARVSIPPEALERISELMSPGASLIISDQGLGPETGKGTDFIVLTR